MGKYLKKKIKDERGVWIQVYGRDQAELDAKYAQRAEEIEAAKRLAGNPYVWEYARAWYERGTKGLSAARKADYSNAINTHICPRIGQLHLAEVTAEDLDALMDGVSHLSRSSQDKITAALRRIFGAAYRAKLIPEDPCIGLRAGGAKPREKHALTPEQCDRLLDAVRGAPAEAFVMVARYTGLRREEVLGLTWAAVQLEGDAPHIRVERACRWEHNRPVVSNKLKSAKARRSVPIPPQLVEWLRAQPEHKPEDYVVHDKAGGACSEVAFRNMWHYIDRRSVGSAWRMVRHPDGSKRRERVQTRLGDVAPHSTVVVTLDFDVTPHILRHTYATELILAGVNIKTVQYLMGHEKVQTTLDIYTHLMENRPEDNIAAVNAAFGGKV